MKYYQKIIYFQNVKKPDNLNVVAKDIDDIM